MKEYCNICGNELEADETGICNNCKASMVSSEDIPL